MLKHTYICIHTYYKKKQRQPEREAEQHGSTRTVKGGKCYVRTCAYDINRRKYQVAGGSMVVDEPNMYVP